MDVEMELNRQMEILTSGAAEVIPKDELRNKVKRSLETGNPLKVKMGIDPTTPDVHLGHMVVYRKIRQFQDLGHRAVLIIGDYTAQIGDPTGRNSERPPLTEEEVKRNSESYTSQIFKIVDRNKADVLFQSEWFEKVSLRETLASASSFSVAHMLTHDTFRKRLESGNRLSLHEMFYPVLQAWDSIFIKADVELGGFDQKFNILCGRDLQRSKGMEPQAALFMPILSGIDGRKMSKSFGNHIAVLSSPAEKFGRIMSISDDLIPDFFLYAAGYSEADTLIVRERLQKENPRDIKMELAEEILKAYHNREEAAKAKDEFIKVFSRRENPKDIPLFETESGEISLTTLLKDSGTVCSVSEGRRLIQQGGLKIDGKKIEAPDYTLKLNPKKEVLIKAGKRRFLRVSLKGEESRL